MNNWLKASKAKLLKEERGQNQFTTEVTVDVSFENGATYEGRELVDINYYDATTLKLNYIIDIELRSWGLKDVTVYGPSGDKSIEFQIQVESKEGEDETDFIDFVGTIDWDKVEMDREYGAEGYFISPSSIELQFDKNCKFVQGTVNY